MFLGILTLLLAVLLPVLCAGCAETTETFLETYPVGPESHLHILNCAAGGPVTVTSWDEDRLEVRAVKSTSRGKAELDKVGIEVELGTTVIVKTVIADERALATVSYDIKVPSTMAVDWIQTKQGRITLEGTRGDTFMETGMADIVARNIEGCVRARTNHGNISLSGTAGVREARSRQGDIQAELLDVGTDQVTIKTTYGSIRLHVSADLNARIDMVIRPNTQAVAYPFTTSRCRLSRRHPVSTSKATWEMAPDVCTSPPRTPTSTSSCCSQQASSNVLDRRAHPRVTDSDRFRQTRARPASCR